jgi:hypothetical protein
VRDDQDLMNILEAVKAATPAPPPEPPPEKRSILYLPFPELRRPFRLSFNGRLAKLEALTMLLSDSTDTPLWIARMAMNAAIPLDHERELDDASNDLPAMERAVEAMGLDTSCLTETHATSH